MLTHLAGADPQGLFLLSSRERIDDVAEYEQGPDHPSGGAQRRDLGNLGERDGARLLHALEPMRAGAEK